MKYAEEVQKGMDLLAAHPDTIFIGQAIEYKGTIITGQVKDYPKEKLLEMPVAEDFQAGFCLGAALEGFIPVCIYPRFNFTIVACNQIVNHIDKWMAMSVGQSRPKIIIKTVVGSDRPLDPGHQHKANYVEAFKHMCDTIQVEDLESPSAIVPAYKQALERPDGVCTILVEYGNYYNEK